MYTIYADGICIYNPMSASDDAKVISPKLTVADSAAGSLVVTIPPTNVGYNSIKGIGSSIIVYEDNEEIWSGRVISEKQDFFKRRKLTCEGEMAYLNDTIQPPAEYHNVTVRGFLETLIRIHNEKVEPDKRFVVGTVTVTDPNDSLYRYTNYESTYGAIKDKLLDRLEGHLVIRKENGIRYLDYISEYPFNANQSIEFGKNLLDFTKSWDWSKFATVIVPRGKQLDESPIEALTAYTTVASVNRGSIYVKSDSAVAEYGWIVQVIDWQDVTEPSRLLTKARKYLTDIQFDDVSLEVNAADLHALNPNIDSFGLLDNVRVISLVHGLDKYFPISKIELELDNPANTTYTMGRADSSNYTARTAAAAQSMATKLDNLEAASVTTNNLAAKVARIDSLTVEDEFAKNIFSSNIVAGLLTSDKIKAAVADIDDLTVDDAIIKNIQNIAISTKYLEATFANINLAEIDKAMIAQLLVEMGVINSAVIVEGHVTGYLDSVEVNAENITAGTLAVDRLLIKDKDGNYKMATYDESGELVVTTIDGSVIKEHTITANHLVANTITAEEIASKAITVNALGDDVYALFDVMEDEIKASVSTNIETYEVSAVPTLTNYPANQWGSKPSRQVYQLGQDDFDVRDGHIVLDTDYFSSAEEIIEDFSTKCFYATNLDGNIDYDDVTADDPLVDDGYYWLNAPFKTASGLWCMAMHKAYVEYSTENPFAGEATYDKHMGAFAIYTHTAELPSDAIKITKAGHGYDGSIVFNDTTTDASVANSWIGKIFYTLVDVTHSGGEKVLAGWYKVNSVYSFRPSSQAPYVYRVREIDCTYSPLPEPETQVYKFKKDGDSYAWTDVTDDPSAYVVKKSAEIAINSEAIKTKVSAGEVVSVIEQTPEVIRLSGNKIAISSTNFNVTEDGVITATSGTIGGFTITDDELYTESAVETENVSTSVTYVTIDDVISGKETHHFTYYKVTAKDYMRLNEQRLTIGQKDKYRIDYGSNAIWFNSTDGVESACGVSFMGGSVEPFPMVFISPQLGTPSLNVTGNAVISGTFTNTLQAYNTTIYGSCSVNGIFYGSSGIYSGSLIPSINNNGALGTAVARWGSLTVKDIDISGQIARSSGGSWIQGRDYAIVKQTKQTPTEGSSWNPVVSVKTSAGNWTIGNAGGEKLGFSYDTDANYTSKTNKSAVYYLNTDGTFSGKATYATSAGSATSATSATSAGSAGSVNGKLTSDGWIRYVSDAAHVKFYGNSRTMVFRTDGTTQYGSNGAFPFIWLYGGDATGNRRMILSDSGDLWTSGLGWLSTAFSGKVNTSSFASGSASYTTSGNSTQRYWKMPNGLMIQTNVWWMSTSIPNPTGGIYWVGANFPVARIANFSAQPIQIMGTYHNGGNAWIWGGSPQPTASSWGAIILGRGTNYTSGYAIGIVAIAIGTY